MALIQIKVKGLSLSKKPRKDGRWQAIYRKKGYMPVYIYGRTEEEMKRNVAEFFNSNKKPKVKAAIKLWDWIKIWLEQYRKPNCATNTYKGDYYTARKYIKNSPIANKPLNRITPVEIQEFLNSIEAKRPRKDTWEVLKLAFRQAKGVHIKKDPMEFVPKYKAKSKRGMPLSRAQQAEFLKKIAGAEYEFFFVTCLYTGARRNEVLALRWEDINIEENYILITKQIDLEDKEDADTKTEQSIRQMPILPQLLPYLKKYQRPYGRLFNYKPDWVSRKAREIFNELGFPKNIKLHNLRNTLATRLYENGVKIEIIRLWLGHIDINTTKRYVDITSELDYKNINFDINSDIKNDD